jgi:uncharacterized membrane protein required for colicin V production
VRAYLVSTGLLFALFAAWHIVELVAHLRSSVSDSGFVLGVSAIIVVTGALSFWAFHLLRGIGKSAA